MNIPLLIITLWEDKSQDRMLFVSFFSFSYIYSIRWYSCDVFSLSSSLLSSSSVCRFAFVQKKIPELLNEAIFQLSSSSSNTTSTSNYMYICLFCSAIKKNITDSTLRAQHFIHEKKTAKVESRIVQKNSKIKANEHWMEYTRELQFWIAFNDLYTYAMCSTTGDILHIKTKT